LMGVTSAKGKLGSVKTREIGVSIYCKNLM
jgi:hypothetical protein